MRKNIYPLIFHFLSSLRICGNGKINKLLAKPSCYKEQGFGIGGPNIKECISGNKANSRNFLKSGLSEININVTYLRGNFTVISVVKERYFGKNLSKK